MSADKSYDPSSHFGRKILQGWFMDFSFTEEQALLQDTVQRFIQNSYDFEARQRLIKTEEGSSPTKW